MKNYLTIFLMSIVVTLTTAGNVSFSSRALNISHSSSSVQRTTVFVIVLEVVLLLLLVPLLILIQQNRVMRRAVSKRRHRTMTGAFYEENLHKQRGSVFSTEQHSGYDNGDELLSDDLPENYDDVVIVQQFCSDKTEQLVLGVDLIMLRIMERCRTLILLSSVVMLITADIRNVRLVNGTSRCAGRVEVLHRGSSLALHDGLVRLSGERQCEGKVEVFIHQVWRRVLLDSWSLIESSVVCRQLGCGSVLNFYGSSSSSPEHSHECVTGFQCFGSEGHLGNCSSPQTLNCSSTQQLSIACLGENNI
ncbi:hypothetical protein QQF64_035201 [Cirrhinus molitorella]|uniref:SRCR domain-containing protein n=1 Tax=Cirrhinus molitorella TaxID=172907 RepID=A0ABR3NF46_9TELE